MAKIVKVNLPTPDGLFSNDRVFRGEDPEGDALKYVQETWGADDQGKVSLLEVDTEPDAEAAVTDELPVVEGEADGGTVDESATA